MARLGKRGAANTGTLLMIAAFVVIGGFLFWLSRTAEPTQVEVQEEPEETGPPALQAAEFLANPRQYAGEEIRVRGLPVTSRLGDNAFWSQVGDTGVPYLIRIGTDTDSLDVTVRSGQDQATVLGTVHPMTDSVLDAWVESGVLEGDVQRLEAEFATTFLEASTVDVSAMPQGKGGGQQGGGSSGGQSGDGV